MTDPTEDMLSAYAAIRYHVSTTWDSVRLRIRRRKCIVSGCEIPSRGRLGKGILAEPWTACGVHRKSLSELLNTAQSARTTAALDANHAFTASLVDGLNDLGCHEDELKLAI